MQVLSFQFVLTGFGHINTNFVSVLHLLRTEFKKASSTYLRIFKFMEWFVFPVDKLLCPCSALLLNPWHSRLVYPKTFWSVPILVVHTANVILDLECKYCLETFCLAPSLWTWSDFMGKDLNYGLKKAYQQKQLGVNLPLKLWRRSNSIISQRSDKLLMLRFQWLHLEQLHKHYNGNKSFNDVKYEIRLE